MKLFELRKRLSPANFIRQSAPILLGASLLVSSSCSNVREFAGRSKSEGSKTEAVAEKAGVEHAYTANHKEDDFVKLLEHKMSKAPVSKPSPQVTSADSSVQDLLAAGKDPFIDDVKGVVPQPAPTPVAQTVIVAKAQTAKPSAPRVLDLGTLSTLEPKSDLPAIEPQLAKTSIQTDEPRPFIDTEIQVAAAEDSSEKSAEVTKAFDSEIVETTDDAVDAPRPFIAPKSELVIDEESSTDAAIAAEITEPDVVKESPLPEAELETEESIAVAPKADDSDTLVQPDIIQQQPVEVVESASPVEQSATAAFAFANAPRQEVGTEFCPAPVASPGMMPPPQMSIPSPAFAQSNMYAAPEIVADEYIHDGGDAGTKVYYSDFARFGLDVEDTIAEYDDDVGVAHVKPSTRATIYAPKFASVRSATLPYTDVKIVKLAGHQDQRTLAGINTKLVIDEKTHNDEALGMRLRSRPSGVEGTAADTSVHQNLAAQRHVKLLNAYEEIRFFREGQLARLNVAVIGDSIAAALDWNGDLGVNIYANDVAGQEVQARITAQDYTGVEDRSTPGDLTIVKVVDKKVAKPGEVLTFTIRFDNTGDRPLRNIRIVDNLSPRLEYVEASVDSDLDGKLDTEDNGRGSQILSFTFDSELKGHTGGWVSFKCKVR